MFFVTIHVTAWSTLLLRKCCQHGNKEKYVAILLFQLLCQDMSGSYLAHLLFGKMYLVGLPYYHGNTIAVSTNLLFSLIS